MIQRSWVRFWRSILDGHDIFSHWFVVKIVMMFVWKDRKMSKKEASNECYNVLFLLVVWRNPIAHNFILSAGVDFLFWFHHFQVDLCCWSSVSLSFQLSSFRVLSWFLFSLFVSSFLFFDLLLFQQKIVNAAGRDSNPGHPNALPLNLCFWPQG